MERSFFSNSKFASLPFLALFLCVQFMNPLFTSGSAFAADVYAVAPEVGVVEKIDTAGQKAWGYGQPDEQVVGRRLVFNLYFTDIRENSHVGFANDAPFSAAARARLREVLIYMGETLNEWGTLDVLVKRSEMDGGGFSAYAGTYYTASAGFQEGAALYRLRHWAKQSPGVPDMFLMVDFGNIYNFSTDAPGPFQEDFASLLLRVLTHGLGFVSLIGETGESIIEPNVYSAWDRHLVRGDGLALIAGRAPAFQGQAEDLTGGDLWFNGSRAFRLYGQGVKPRVHAPSRFRAGESLSHWAPGAIEGGAVMEAVTPLGSVRREWSAVDIGALADIGYMRISDDITGGWEGGMGCAGNGAMDAWTSFQNALHEILLTLGLFMVMAGRRFLNAGRKSKIGVAS